jgi:membrane-bound lytic murein transglycosylase B
VQKRQVVSADRNQAEFTNTYALYLKRVSPWRIKKGRELLRSEQEEMITQVAQAHGVQARFIVAILGMETNYGTFELNHSVFNVVATLAFDGRRAAQFRSELLAALEIVDKGYASPQMLSSSWAGALGFPQFNPSNYLRLAVDEDRDGKRDIWQMGPDVIGSVANYLKDADWRDDQTWGREVRLPPEGETSLQGEQSEGLPPAKVCKKYKTLGIWRSLPEWQSRGVRTKWGASLPTRPLAAALVIGDEGDNKGYLVYQNFCSLLRYNPSFRYALGVSLLSDRMGN